MSLPLQDSLELVAADSFAWLDMLDVSSICKSNGSSDDVDHTQLSEAAVRVIGEATIA